jgi:glutamate formiminotransferase
VHPRIGALDVLPFVPLTGLSMADARTSAHRVGARIAHDLGVPVFFYADASQPPGRTLPELRRGGFEALSERWPDDRVPDLLPPNYAHPGAHPTAGASCVGARELLLAWNVLVSGIPFDVASAIAESLRERTGGFAGVRALALHLPSRGALQISMNLEQLEATPPMVVFRRLETLVTQAGGRIEATEVIGMIPDALVLSAAADRLRLSSPSTERLLSKRLLAYLGDTERGSLQPTTPGSTDA